MTLYEIKQNLLSGKTIFDLPLKVAYYARVSTEKEEQINSLENQVSFFEDYIRKNKNWKFIRGYTDEGISGTTSLKRNHFMQMIEDSKKDEFDLIISKEVSRFSRDTIDSLFYTRKLLEYDVCVYFLSDNIITASNDGELRLTIMSSMAQDEVRKISERTKFGFKRAIDKGTVLGTNNIWGYKKDNGKLVIDSKEAPIIKNIFNIYANDNKIGLKKLSLLLSKQGFFNHNGNLIHQNTLKRIIQNPKYKGFYTGGISNVIDYRTKKRNINDPLTWKIYKDYEKVPPIVSEELWEKANQKLKSRSKSCKMYQKHQTKYALSGKIFCLKHNCAFVRKIKHLKNKDIIYWYCKNFHITGKKTCVPASFKEEDLYNILLSVFKKFEVYRNDICNDLISIYSNCLTNTDIYNQEIKLKNDLYLLENKKHKLLELSLDGLFSKEEILASRNLIENKISDIKSNLDKIDKLSHNNKNIEKFYINLKEAILKEIEINQENLEFYIDGLLNKIIIEENVYDEMKNNNTCKGNYNKLSNQINLKIIFSSTDSMNFSHSVNK